MMDNFDQVLLDRLQQGLPVAERPFAALCAELDEDSILARIARLQTLGLIRRLGGFFDSRRLGYQGTLIALAVDTAALPQTAAYINQFGGVTHNYERDFAYNLWFTLLYRNAREKAEILAGVGKLGGVGEILDLPSLKTYKVRVALPISGKAAPPETPNGVSAPLKGGQEVRGVIDDIDKKIINALSRGLPLTPRPFANIATTLLPPFQGGWPVGPGGAIAESEAIRRVQSYLDTGVLRRIGAVIAHTRAGYAANGLCAFAAPPAEIDAIGREMAKEPLLSHCYRRQTAPHWGYNLYAMIHGKTKGETNALAAALAAKFNLSDYRIMYSTREWKKSPLIYFDNE